MLHNPGAKVRRKPLHNSFEDFRKPLSFSQFQSLNPLATTSSPLRSELEVLMDCFMDEEPTLHATNASVLNLAYHALRINIAEWKIYCQVMARYLSYYEYSLRNVESTIHGERGDMVDLQKWRRRALQTQHKIRSTRNFVRYWSAREQTGKEDIWSLIVNDFDLVFGQIEQYGQSLERMIPVVTSMVQLSGSQRSITESVNVRRLTYVALVFIPLSWVASIFSMADEYAPGHSKFWVYFVVSIPLCVVIVSGSYLVNIPNFDWFKLNKNRPRTVGEKNGR